MSKVHHHLIFTDKILCSRKFVEKRNFNENKQLYKSVGSNFTQTMAPFHKLVQIDTAARGANYYQGRYRTKLS
jgi:hypothetical protein